jgi:2-deoxy-D-gluconate 3-dehydrogenase
MSSALLRAGAGVMIVGRRKEVLDRALGELNRFGSPVVAMSADVTGMGDAAGIVGRAVREFGKVDFLFNNAGMIRRGTCEDYTELDWDLVLQTNLKAPFFLAQAVARNMIAAGHGGSIVNISSVAGLTVGTGIPAYGASKAGIAHLTKTLAKAWAKYGIRVNGIAPGWFITEMSETVRNDPQRSNDILGKVPMARWGNPEELGGAAVFLISDASSYVTGHTLVVDGGLMAF